LLKQQLIDKGRLGWALEEFSLLSVVQWSPINVDEPAYLRMKGAKALNGRGLAVLRELFQWRADLAQRTDRAAFRILNNEPMLFMAKSPPADFQALKEVRGIGPEQAERRGKDILAAVNRGLAIPEAELPRIPRPPRRSPDPAYEARLERLKGIRNQLAGRYDLAPGVLCSNGTLEAIARTNPATIEEMAEVPGLRRWQLQEFGGDLLKALQRPAA
jgi:ribonuclease D